jgi:hypothetical protein
LRAEPESAAAITGTLPLTVAVLLASAALIDCSRDTGDIAPLRLKHSPPIAQLSGDELRSLSMDCDSYPPHGTMRGRYEAAYCEEAMAAWSDAPLQMITVKP